MKFVKLYLNGEEIDDDILQELNEYYKNFVVLVDNEEVSEQEKVVFVQQMQSYIDEWDDEILKMSEAIDEITTSYDEVIEELELKKELSSSDDIDI